MLLLQLAIHYNFINLDHFAFAHKKLTVNSPHNARVIHYFERRESKIKTAAFALLNGMLT